MRASLLFLPAVVFLATGATPAAAGGRSTNIGLVDLDENPKAKRFDKLKSGFDAAIKQGASSVIEGAEVIPRATVARFLRPGCGLAMPWEEWKKLEAQRSDWFMDYLVLYCSSGPGPSITVAVYGHHSEKPFMVVKMEAFSGSVGRPAMRSLARAIIEFSSMRFSP